MKILTRYIVVLACVIAANSSNIFAQQDTTVVAKVALLIKKTPTTDEQIAAVSITLTNTSDQDIYIPEIFCRDRNLPINARLMTYVWQNGKYERDGFYGKDIPEIRSEGFWSNHLTGSRNLILEKYNSVGVNKANEMNTILNEFAKKNPKSVKRLGLEPLFLKAHESYEINLLKDLDKLVTLPYNFKVFYQLDYKQKSTEPYPENIQGYKLFLPKVILSNILYLQPER